MSKSVKLKNDNYWDSSSIVHNKKMLNNILNTHFYGYNDTVGSDIKELLRNKMAYGDSLCTEQIETIMFNGGWRGIEFGFAIYTRNTQCKHVLWISINGIFICKYAGGQYFYKQILSVNL